MNVETLIKILQSYPPQTLVKCHDGDGEDFDAKVCTLTIESWDINSHTDKAPKSDYCILILPNFDVCTSM